MIGSGGKWEEVKSKDLRSVGFWLKTVIAPVIGLFLLGFVFYFLGYIEKSKLLSSNFVSIVLGTVTVYFIYRLRSAVSLEKLKGFYKLMFIGAGATIAWIIVFVGGGLTLYFLGINLNLGWELFVYFFILPWAIGGVFGYYWGKRRNFMPYM